MRTGAKIFLLGIILLHSCCRAPIVIADSTPHEMELVTVFLYHGAPDVSREIALAIALYGAKYKAVLLAADQLAEKGLLTDDDGKKMAVFCLVVDELPFILMDESFDETSRTCQVQIKSSISLADFVKAEIKNEALENDELHFSLKEEMEQIVPPRIAPALELSRAYRYIGKRQWRIAIIYLDHLEKKYPQWGALFYSKAMAYLGMHETEKAISALTSACYLGNQDACLKINALDPSD